MYQRSRTASAAQVAEGALVGNPETMPFPRDRYRENMHAGMWLWLGTQQNAMLRGVRALFLCVQAFFFGPLVSYMFLVPYWL